MNLTCSCPYRGSLGSGLRITRTTISTTAITPYGMPRIETKLVLKPLYLFLIQHDDEVLDLETVTLPELRKVVEMNGAILWDMQGDLRILPCNIIADHIRVAAARYESERLNRAIGLPPKDQWCLKLAFMWDQARPITSAELASATSHTP